MIRRWLYIALVIVATSFLAVVYDQVLFYSWVGYTELEIEFVVTDSGRPVPGASVQVHSEGGFFKGGEEEEDFVLVTDGNGIARTSCDDVWCSGEKSGLRLTDTYDVYMPWWQFQVTAPDYHASECYFLASREFNKQVQRLGPGKAKLVVPIQLVR